MKLHYVNQFLVPQFISTGSNPPPGHVIFGSCVFAPNIPFLKALGQLKSQSLSSSNDDNIIALSWKDTII